MDQHRRHGKPEEELFMQQDTEQPETPTVPPLRVNKAASPLPSLHAASSYGGSPSQAASMSDNEQAPTSLLPHAAPAPHAPIGSGSYTSPSDYAQSPYSTYSGRNDHKPLPESLVPAVPDKGTFTSSSMQETHGGSAIATPALSYTAYSQQSFPNPVPPPPVVPPVPEALRVPKPDMVSRIDSTASVSTTKAHRGSPVPPETPPKLPTSDIEARYAAPGTTSPETLSSLQSQRLAAAHPENQTLTAAPTPGGQGSAPRLSTPTESATAQGPQYHSGELISNSGATQPTSLEHEPQSSLPNIPLRGTALEEDLQQLHVSDEPPPAYSSALPPSQGYYAENKNTATAAGVAGISAAAIGAAAAATAAGQHDHPASSSDVNRAEQSQHDVDSSQTQPRLTSEPLQSAAAPTEPFASAVPGPASGPPAPPPLPEGWIAHIDPNTQQYYYIHLPTQATQWEFPKGPKPLHLDNQSQSPTGTTSTQTISPNSAKYGSGPLGSPGLSPQQTEYRPSVLSMSTLGSHGGSTYGLPPDSGIDMYRVSPTNGVYFGPYLRYTNLDIDNGVWFGSILLVTESPHPPTIHIHQSVDLSPNPRQLKANPISRHQRWTFYRYDIDLKMEDDHEAKWTYAITSHLGCTRYEFTVAGRYERSWRFLAHSGTDFALNINGNERSKLGGVGFMWKDVLQKHQDLGGFHAQLGVGNQIYADRIWKDLPSLREWTSMSGKENRKNAPWTARHEEDATHAYFHYYTSHFDQDYVREAFAQIPHVLALDDHDIFDGFGSYPEYMQLSAMFKNIGRIGVEMYLLFQHHTTMEILRNVHTDFDLFTITGTGWHFIKYLGPSVVVVAPDCRSERTQHQVMAGPTYQGLFPKIALLPTNVQHCIWMIPVPIIYPRLDTAEQIANTMATGKRAVTGTFNAVGKVAGSVAGIVGAKGVVGEGFASVKKAVGKSGLMSNILSPFGELDILDELRDQWTHESKDLERTYLIRTLQGIAHNKSLRMTFLSGAVNTCGAGLVHDPTRPADHKTMYQIISSAVVNAPPSPYVLKMLSTNSNKPLYIPLNGQRSSPQPSDTKEDMLEMFGTDIAGQPRDIKRLMERRNYAIFVSYDPDLIQSGALQPQGAPKPPGASGPKTNLAVDFLVQGDAGAKWHAANATVKYGPVVIPCLEYGR